MIVELTMSNDFKGVLYFLSSCVLFAFINSVLKKLSISLSPYEIMGYRTLFAAIVTFIISLAFIKSIPYTKLRKDNIFRVGIEIISMPLWIISISKLDISQAVSLSFTTPIFAAILASVFLNDKMRMSSIISCVIGLIGAIIVINPRSEEISVYAILTLIVCVCWASSSVFIKKLTTSTQHPLHIVLYTNTIIALCMLPIILISSQRPSIEELGNILILAVTGLAAHFLLAMAMKHSKISKIVPFDYTRLIFSAAFAYLFFGEIITNNTIIGSIIIFLASSYVAISIAKDQVKAGQNHAKH